MRQTLMTEYLQITDDPDSLYHPTQTELEQYDEDMNMSDSEISQMDISEYSDFVANLNAMNQSDTSDPNQASTTNPNPVVIVISDEEGDTGDNPEQQEEAGQGQEQDADQAMIDVEDEDSEATESEEAEGIEAGKGKVVIVVEEDSEATESEQSEDETVIIPPLEAIPKIIPPLEHVQISVNINITI